MGEAVLGILANPMSGRDIRRLVARASVFPTAEKANMVQRLLIAAGTVGVERVLLSTDVGGISATVLRAVEANHAAATRPRREPTWPPVEFVGPRVHTQTAADSVETVHRMIDAGARVIICLGGDGTARVVASACGEVPMLPLSTGTNNAFPRIREATVAGLAAALVATGAVPADLGTTRATTLLVEVAGRVENALVDVCVSRTRDVGARALWDPDALGQLFCTFAEPDGIGLSSIPGLLCPTPRDEPDGVLLTLCPPRRRRASCWRRSRRDWCCRWGCVPGDAWRWASRSPCTPRRAWSRWTASARSSSAPPRHRWSGSAAKGPVASTSPRCWPRRRGPACSGATAARTRPGRRDLLAPAPAAPGTYPPPTSLDPRRPTPIQQEEP